MPGACPLCETVLACERGEHPLLVAGLGRSVVVLGENQGCPGWCVLVLREHVEHMDAMDIGVQREVFGEVARVARAVRAGSPGRAARINYECLGNRVAHVHWHVIPRHADDPDPRNPVWGWPEERLRGSMTAPERAELARAIGARLA